MVNGKSVSRAEQRQEDADGEDGAFTTGTESQHANWRRQHPQTAAKASL